MGKDHFAYQAYMLRIWTEKDQNSTTQHASLEDPHTGKIWGFSSLEALFDFLSNQLNEKKLTKYQIKHKQLGDKNMKNFLLWGSSVLMAIFFVVLLVLPASATTITVTNNNDSGTGSLRQAIINAEDGDTITFEGDYVITLASTLEINKDLTIDGGEHTITISGNDTVRVFHIDTGKNVTLDHLIITHGMNDEGEIVIDGEEAEFDGGGGIKIETNSVVTLTNSSVISNTSYFYDEGQDYYYGLGGGIYNAGELIIFDSIFNDNAVGDTESGWAAGAAIFNASILEIVDSTISENNALNQSAMGAGIYNSYGTANIQNSIISDNNASNFGNGAGFYNNTGTASIQNSTISGNIGGCSAGIENSDGLMSISDSRITNNTMPSSCEGGSAGISNRFGTMTVTNSSIDNNTSDHYNGGVINYQGTITAILNMKTDKKKEVVKNK